MRTHEAKEPESKKTSYTFSPIMLIEVLRGLVNTLMKRIDADEKYTNLELVKNVQNAMLTFTYNIHIIQTKDNRCYIDYEGMKKEKVLGNGNEQILNTEYVDAIEFIKGEARQKSGLTEELDAIARAKTYAATRERDQFSDRFDMIVVLGRFYSELVKRIEQIWQIQTDQYFLRQIKRESISVDNIMSYQADLPMLRFSSRTVAGKLEFETMKALQIPEDLTKEKCADFQAWIRSAGKEYLRELDSKIKPKKENMEQKALLALISPGVTDLGRLVIERMGERDVVLDPKVKHTSAIRADITKQAPVLKKISAKKIKNKSSVSQAVGALVLYDDVKQVTDYAGNSERSKSEGQRLAEIMVNEIYKLCQLRPKAKGFAAITKKIKEGVAKKDDPVAVLLLVIALAEKSRDRRILGFLPRSEGMQQFYNFLSSIKVGALNVDTLSQHLGQFANFILLLKAESSKGSVAPSENKDQAAPDQVEEKGKRDMKKSR